MKTLKKMKPAEKTAKLVEIAEQLHEALDIETSIKTKGLKDAGLIKIITKEASLIEPDDELDEELVAYLTELGVMKEFEEEEDEDEDEDEDEEEEEDEDEDEEEEEEDEDEEEEEEEEEEKPKAKTKGKPAPKTKEKPAPKVKGKKKVEEEDEDEDEDEEEEEEEKPKAKTKGKEKEKAKTTAAPKSKGGQVPMANFVDGLIKEGGPFKTLIKKAQAEGDKRGLKQKYTEGYFRFHVKFREKNEPGWLKKKMKKVMTEKGFEDK